ncbi:condensin-2 complex subunit D3 [Cucurbita maxima]|uniref:Condensin-2 complex subunit D3 n=1 Tax=Cucurbita maxima TaxID=3661 RepID=A0A6J1L4I0_CUCMA|nr:condensin-2 complex subunit D3 [Cucurbita maxima]
MEEAVSRILTELEEARYLDGSTNLHSQPPPPLSDSALFDLQSLLDNSIGTDEQQPVVRLYEDLSAKSLSPSFLIRAIASAMDEPSPRISILASKVYLSLLLAPNAPVFTLFNPMDFLSFLRSMRRFLKQRPRTTPNQDDSNQESIAPKRKRKGGVKGKGLRNCAQRQSFNGEHHDGECDARVLYPVLERLGILMSLIHLDRFPDSLKSLVETVFDIPVLAREVCTNLSIYSKLTNLCSRILSATLRPEHGDLVSIAAEVIKSLSPLILHHKDQARAFALEFVTIQIANAAKESDGVKSALVNLPRYLVQKAPEKSEPRALAVDSIMEVVKVMEFKDQIGFVDYVVKMTRGKSNLRLLAIDLISTLIMSLSDPVAVDSESELKDSWRFGCLVALVQRCSDAGAAIRARALSNLAHLVVFLSDNDKNKALLKEVLGSGDRHCKKNGSEIHALLRKRCVDEKAAVRKAALFLVTKCTALLGGSMDGDMLKTVGIACSDPLVSIRKAAMSALSEAFRRFPDESVTVEWLHSIPRLIADNESSIQEECENLFQELVLDRLSRVGSSSLPRDGSRTLDLKRQFELLIPGVLDLLKEISHAEVMPWVKKVCANLGKKKRFESTIAVSLQTIIKTSESLWLSQSLPPEKWTAPPGAWFLLSEVSAYLVKAVDWEFLHHHWKILDDHGRAEFGSPVAQVGLFGDENNPESNSIAWAQDRVFLLQTISNVSLELPPEPAEKLAHELIKKVEEFSMHSTEVNAHVKTLKTLCKRKAMQSAEADEHILTWVNQLLSKASQILEKYISKHRKAKKDVNFITPPPKSGSRLGKRATAPSKSLSRAITAAYTIGSLIIICPSADITTIIPLLHTVITSGNRDSKSNKLPIQTVSIRETAPSLYVQAWLTMGKICLADEKCAKSYIPLFVQELENSDCAALRNNLVITMADFCVRYTALVDCYLTKITKCLRDPCELVRRHTFILLSRLLQRDYVKWRGVLFLRFLLSLVDESEKIRQLADFLFGNILKVKAPLLAYNSFVEAIYVLNDCRAHSGHNDSKASRAESRLFSIRGNDESSRRRRMHIYVSLLKQMAPGHLLATFAKLCSEILGEASDGKLSMDDTTARSVLQDTFDILACKEIRLSINRGSSSESGDVDEEGGESGGVSAARGKVITHVVRKGLIQNSIPIFTELKRLMESKNSPLIGSLMECLLVLLKDYKNDIDDMLVADKQLQKELVYDIQKYEATKAKSAAAEAVNEMQKSANYLSPEAPPHVRNSINKLTSKLQKDSRVASAIADVTAAATAKSVLREVNRGTSTPPLGSLSLPKLKSCTGGNNGANTSRLNVIESVRKRQSFDSDEEN